MKALVTGGTGFLGAALIRRLRAEGVRVRALRRPDSNRPVDADEIVTGDLRRAMDLAPALAGMDWVFHAGARVSRTGAWEEFQTVNVDATAELIRLAVEARVRRFVHVSSLSVYAVPHDDAEVTEDSGFEPDGSERGYYARSKLAADQVAATAASRGAPVTIVRPGLLYGAGRRPPLARRARSVGPFQLIFARPGYLLPLAYVDNVADALYLAAASDRAVGRAYTIVDEHVPQRDYLRLYRSIAGATWVPIYLPARLLGPAVGVVETLVKAAGRRPPVTRHQIERTVWSATFSTARARDELGWCPRVSLETALRRSLTAGPGQATPAAGGIRPAAQTTAP